MIYKFCKSVYGFIIEIKLRYINYNWDNNYFFRKIIFKVFDTYLDKLSSITGALIYETFHCTLHISSVSYVML